MLRPLKSWLYSILARSSTVQRWLIAIGATGAVFSKGSPGGVYLIFQTCNVGGAEWVHNEIAFAVARSNPWILFSHPSREPSFAEGYAASAAKIVDLSDVWPRKARRLVALGFLAGLINRQAKPVVFGSLTPMFYELLPLLKDHVQKIDLTHSFDGHREHWQSAYASFLDQRVVISYGLRGEMLSSYKEQGIAEALGTHIRVIPNAVAVPLALAPKPSQPPLRVLFVGRGTNEGGKRIQLIGQIAKQCVALGLDTEFTLVGPGVEDCVESDCLPFVRCPGPILEPERLTKMYTEHHVLIMVSVSEGVPIAILQAMAEGTIPLVTNVGAISEVVDESVGFLINSKDETEILGQCVSALEALLKDQGEREALSRAAYARAKGTFSLPDFHAAYRKLILDQPRPGAKS